MSGVPDSVGALVLERGAPLALAAGAVLFSEGDRSTSVYACRSGRLKVTMSTPTGDELLLGWKRPGDGFGELSALDGGARSARVVAVTAAELAVLGRAEFLDALRTAPDLAVALLSVLSEQLRRANSRIAATKSDRIPVRVAHRLLELLDQLERHGGVSATAELAITQDDLAAWIGATRESTARALGALRRQRVIDTGRGRIVVLDRGALERAVAEAGP